MPNQEIINRILIKYTFTQSMESSFKEIKHLFKKILDVEIYNYAGTLGYYKKSFPKEPLFFNYDGKKNNDTVTSNLGEWHFRIRLVNNNLSFEEQWV